MQPESGTSAPRVDLKSIVVGPGPLGGSDTLADLPTDKAALRSPEQRSAFNDIRQICAGLPQSRHWKELLALAIGIMIVLVGVMTGQVYLNLWNGAFFDAIEKKDLAEVGHQLLVFTGIIAVLLALVVSQTWLQEITKLKVREWLTDRLLDDWLVKGRAYRLGISTEAGVNPDQRMQEDAKHLSELSAELGIGMLHHVFLFVTFIGVLWGLSSGISFSVAGVVVAIPGYMVWCAIAYAVLGSFLTWWVGRRLVSLNATRYAREAELRFGLVRASERAEAIALYGGEPDERRIINRMLADVLVAVRRLAFALARLTWITSGYGWIAIVVPIVVALPGYLHGSLSLGGLMMVVGAFNQVQAALRWFVDNYARIADWRAALYRIAVFDEALQSVDDVGLADEQIVLAAHPQQRLAFENVSVLTADRRVVIEDATAEIKPGERILIVGESGSGKSTLFRAVAGLWPWGSGRILLPPQSSMMFMPQHPYLPLGTLRAATCYPDPPTTYSDADIEAALERVGLSEFITFLDREERWDKVMSLGQQQRLAFARLLLHKPKWVFLDEATGALDLENQARVMSLFETELKDTTIVSIGHRPSLEEFHGRALQLIATSEGALLRRRPQPEPERPHGWIDLFLSWFEPRKKPAASASGVVGGVISDSGSVGSVGVAPATYANALHLQNSSNGGPSA
jgi:vitamin B12/bleomycin/antimicrobial peptide transport system ATP-binding/permease protein